MTIDESIRHYEQLAENQIKCADRIDELHCDSTTTRYMAEHHRQLAEWLSELKAYKDLSTYNRENKCCECEYEDSEYFCDDCIWNFVDKFKQREVNTDDNR